ncbi:hypothetical protein PAXRUDRAFT_805379 [Paxillus rubicundulus Ve08.2h10]|uniref:Unplaced genomic scaffold scaffold_848, whole genome shotgun sequence n=1 Tax=Paxillus rubicundulus Ve08.2h10 TaxID=930991 RepID=A0A0D0DR95_9AGAM|nr:hypothetical protein PAXRUDRAFT_805379 [Paxillus rubicundulus Ve08.2h10]
MTETTMTPLHIPQLRSCFVTFMMSCWPLTSYSSMLNLLGMEISMLTVLDIYPLSFLY